MAFTNTFQVTTLLSQGLPDYANSLGTTVAALPYDKFNDNATVGTTINELYPLRLIGYNTLAVDLSTQNNNIFDRIQPITLSIEQTVPFAMTGQQMTFFSKANSEEEFSNRYLESAAITTGNLVNGQVLAILEKYWSDAVGDPTQTINGISSLATAASQFSNMGLRTLNGENDLYLGLSPNTYNQLLIPYATYYNESINLPILRDGQASWQYGMNVYMDNLMIQHTNGTFATSGTVTVATSVPTTTTINDASTTVALSGFTASQTGVLKRGDLISFGTVAAGNPVYALNPQSYNTFNNLKTFYVTADVNSDGSGNASVTVFAPIVANSADPYRNVSRQVVSGMAVTLYGGANAVYNKGFGFSRKGFYFSNPQIATFPLPRTPETFKFSAFPNEDVESMTVPGSNLKVALNIASQGDIGAFNNQFTIRTIAAALAFNGYGFTFCSKP